MKELAFLLVVLGMALALPGEAFGDDQEDYGRGHMIGPRHAWDSGHVTGPGSGGRRGHMMDYDHRGWGMRGRGWESMKPEQRPVWDKMRTAHLKDTLELRKQLATKQIELDTLWAQPQVDRKKVEELSNEVADLRAKLWKKRDQYLMQCREEFGDQNWACPGTW
jgi:Spy/CpxP family protein refolding chaperone